MFAREVVIEMLNIGVIGYGGRVRDVLRGMKPFKVPYRVAAVADPRAKEIAQKPEEWESGCRYFESADEMIEKAEDLHGIMIGTRCFMHTEMACKAARRKLPIFLEKPVAIAFEQVKKLAGTFAGYPAPVVVSFPLRLTPIVQKVRELIGQGTIGEVAQVAAFNDVPYGRVYFNHWYRNHEQVGGLFLQKATHDLDCVAYLLGRRPAWVCAMKSQRVYGGDKPHDLRCRDCAEKSTCPESSFALFYETLEYGTDGPHEHDLCVYSREIRNEDSSSALIEYDNGVQASYTQNVFIRHRAARRGARLYGAKGTIEFDWYKNAIHVYSHRLPTETTINFTGNIPHFGGDRELCYDFLMAMKEGRPTRSPLSAGISSALLCLWARESAEARRFCEVRMPGEG